MKTLKPTFIAASAAAIFALGAQHAVLAQAPVRDDDINGESAFGKSELAASDKKVIPDGDLRGTNIMTMVKNNPRFTILTEMLEKAGLDKIVMSSEDITFFAPTDEAFEKMTKEELAAMKSDDNKDNLVNLLGFHVSPSILKSDMMTDPVTLKTMAGDEELEIATRVDDGDVHVLVGGLAKVVSPDVEMKNGVVHVIDRVLFPKRNAAQE